MLDLTKDIVDDAAPSRSTDSAPVNDTPRNDAALLDAYSNAVIDVTDRVGPAVVRVETGPKVRTQRERGGLGSGIVISPDGLVLTNSHVVGTAKEIRLRDTEGVVTDARVLGAASQRAVERRARKAQRLRVAAHDCHAGVQGLSGVKTLRHGEHRILGSAKSRQLRRLRQ